MATFFKSAKEGFLKLKSLNKIITLRCHTYNTSKVLKSVKYDEKTQKDMDGFGSNCRPCFNLNFASSRFIFNLSLIFGV